MPLPGRGKGAEGQRSKGGNETGSRFRFNGPLTTDNGQFPFRLSCFPSAPLLLCPLPLSMKLTFLGAAGEVTGSQHLLETRKLRVLLDCGLFQGAAPRPGGRTKSFTASPQSSMR